MFELNGKYGKANVYAETINNKKVCPKKHIIMQV